MPVKINCYEDCRTCIPVVGFSDECAGSRGFSHLCIQSLYFAGSSSTLGLCRIIFPIFLALNAAFCVFWLVVRRRYALFPLCVFLIGWGALTTYLPWQLGGAEKPVGSVLKILTYNTMGMPVEKMKMEKNRIRF